MFAKKHDKLRKYPRTYHFTWSEGAKNDDRILERDDIMAGMEIVVTEKLDGECVSGDTLISTPNGNTRICDLTIGDAVLSVDDNNEIVESIISQTYKSSDEIEWFEIETDTGEILKVTKNHKVFLPKLGCYRKVEDLMIGDDFLIFD